MNTSRNRIIECARDLAARLPSHLVVSLAHSIEDAPDKWSSRRTAALSVASEPSYREHATALLDQWQADVPEMAPAAVAMALLAAAHCEDHHRDEQSVELVWTGPEAGAIPLRRTDQALLEVINAAQERLIVVSFAVYKAQRILDAITEAAHRGVRVDVILETPERRVAEKAIYECGAFESGVSIYVWPREKRPVDKAGNCGSLHVKCAVADERRLFLSSANLTEYAFSLNMELGVLIRGGPLPGKVSSHFGHLMECGALVRYGEGQVP